MEGVCHNGIACCVLGHIPGRGTGAERICRGAATVSGCTGFGNEVAVGSNSKIAPVSKCPASLAWPSKKKGTLGGRKKTTKLPENKSKREERERERELGLAVLLWLAVACPATRSNADISEELHSELPIVN